MRPFRGIAGLILICTTCVTASAAPQKWAVLIGVDDYVTFTDLSYCSKDVDALAKTLQRAGFSEDNIYALTNEPATRNGMRPSRRNIETKLKLVLELVKDGDLLIVAFSGHGVQLDGTDYLCPFDAHLEKPADTMVRLQWVYDRMEACKASQKVLLVDACRNLPARSLDDSKSVANFARSLADFDPPKGICQLSSCAGGQKSYEDQEFKQGVFMHFVIQGLAGEADRTAQGNNDGEVNLLELFAYTAKKTSSHVIKNHDATQTPKLKSEELDYNITLCKVSSAPGGPIGPATTGSTGAAPGLGEPPVFTVKMELAEQYYRTGKYQEAVVAYTEAMAQNPGDRSVYIKRAQAYASTGNYTKALEDYKAGGQQLQLPAKRTSSLYVNGKAATPIRADQILTITAINGNFLGVTAIDGDPSQKGWVKADAVRIASVRPTRTTGGATRSTGGYGYPSGQTPLDKIDRAVRTASGIRGLIGY